MFTATLTGGQQAPPVASGGTGLGTVLLNAAEDQITVNLTFSGLTTPSILGHIHGPAAVGANAGVLFDFADDVAAINATAGTIPQRTFAITPAQVAELKAGLYYFNVHTTNFPGGEIRGQITAAATQFTTTLTGAQQVPPVVSPGTGTGMVALNAAEDVLIVNLTWSGLPEPAILGHIHGPAAAGANAGVLFDFAADVAAINAAAGTIPQRTFAITPAQVAELKSGLYYFNINTPTNSGGEIRGQINPTPVTPPAPPTGLRLTRTGPDTAAVSWSASNTATQYSVLFSLTAGGPKTPVGTPTATSTNVTGLTRGQAYFFVVSASNAAGSSQNSPEVRFVIPLADAPSDFDSDGSGDLTIWRPGSGTWFWATSGLGFAGNDATQLGEAGDTPVKGDIDGDGKPDLIVWKPSTGTFSWLTSSTGYNTASLSSKRWGTAGDVPLLGDLDGDGRDDLVVWRPTAGVWFWLTSSSGYDYAQYRAIAWGTVGDTPMLGDFDGDKKADLTVWRGSNGVWFSLLSTASYSYGNYFVRQWGLESVGDVPLLGDTDGDGRSDLVVWRASTGTFFWITSSTSYSYAAAGVKQWGSQALGDVPLLGDLDGDRRSDLIVWRPGNGIWFALTSSSSYNYAAQLNFRWGIAGDVPLIK